MNKVEICYILEDGGHAIHSGTMTKTHILMGYVPRGAIQAQGRITYDNGDMLFTMPKHIGLRRDCKECGRPL